MFSSMFFGLPRDEGSTLESFLGSGQMAAYEDTLTH